MHDGCRDVHFRLSMFIDTTGTSHQISCVSVRFLGVVQAAEEILRPTEAPKEPPTPQSDDRDPRAIARRAGGIGSQVGQPWQDWAGRAEQVGGCMRVPIDFRHALAAGGFFALAMIGGCSDNTPTGVAAMPEVEASRAEALLTSADVIIPGTDAGAFAHTIVPNNSGWSTTEFWDNGSDDGVNCNLGFYAVGEMGLSGPCSYGAPGSDANQGGFVGGMYWGNGPRSQDVVVHVPRSDAYRVKYLASYAAENSEVGYFTKTAAGAYTFTKLWDTKAIDSIVFVPPMGATAWGFYFKHPGHEETEGDCSPQNDCSDAQGEMHAGTHSGPAIRADDQCW